MFILFLRHKLIKLPLFDFCLNCTSSGDRQLEQPARHCTVRSSPQKSGCHKGQKQGVISFGKSVDLSVDFCEGTSVIAVVLFGQQWNYQSLQESSQTNMIDVFSPARDTCIRQSG